MNLSAPAATRGRDIARVLVAALVAVPLLTAGSCGPTIARACDVRHSDLVVRDGQVLATAHPYCDPPPATHLLKAVIEVAVGDTWIEFGRAVIVDAIPDATGFDVTARAECREGTYRLRVQVDGTGPDGIPYRFDDTGPETAIALVECAG